MAVSEPIDPAQVQVSTPAIDPTQVQVTGPPIDPNQVKIDVPRPPAIPVTPHPLPAGFHQAVILHAQQHGYNPNAYQAYSHQPAQPGAIEHTAGLRNPTAIPATHVDPITPWLESLALAQKAFAWVTNPIGMAIGKPYTDTQGKGTDLMQRPSNAVSRSITVARAYSEKHPANIARPTTADRLGLSDPSGAVQAGWKVFKHGETQRQSDLDAAGNINTINKAESQLPINLENPLGAVPLRYRPLHEQGAASQILSNFLVKTIVDPTNLVGFSGSMERLGAHLEEHLLSSLVFARTGATKA